MQGRMLISALSRGFAPFGRRAFQSFLNCNARHQLRFQPINCRSLSTLPNLPLFRALQDHDQSSVAVIHSASSRSFTYGNLVADVVRAKERLLKCAGGQQDGLAGERIAFLAENSYDYVVTLLSILAIDAIALPLSPAFPVGELKYIMDNSQAKVLVATEKYAAKAHDIFASLLPWQFATSTMIKFRPRLSLFTALRAAPPTRRFATEARLTSDHVRIVEVGARDGLQNEKKSIPLETKLQLIEKLSKTGVTTIEAGSFVPAKWVPQMASTAEICEKLLTSPPQSQNAIAYNYLVPNIKGLENLVKIMDTAGAPAENTKSSTSTEISLFAAATEAFSKANTNCTIAESLERIRPIVELAKTKNIRVRGYVSVALGCPYEGPDVPPSKVADITATLLEMGADEVSVADTTGMGTAPRTMELLQALKAAGIANNDLALHFHDTYGQALVNTVVGLEHGIRIFDSSVGGLGGCPYSKGATGNISTEDLVHTLHSLGMHTGINLEEMAKIGGWISGELDRFNESRAGKATLARIQE